MKLITFSFALVFCVCVGPVTFGQGHSTHKARELTIAGTGDPIAGMRMHATTRLIKDSTTPGYKITTTYDQLKSGFAKPTGSALPKVYWWWINGNMDTVRMKEELKNIKNAGIGGVDIFEIGFRPDGVMPAGPAFMGPESLKAIGAAIREAGKLGLEVGLNLSSSWNAGGTWITAEHSAKSLYQSKLQVKNGETGIKLPFPTIPKIDKNGKPLRIEWATDGRPVYRKEIAVIAVPADRFRGLTDTSKGLTDISKGLTDTSKGLTDTSAVLNLTSLFDEKTETLNWKVPPGDWTIYRFVCSSSGEELKLPSPHSAGPIIDHFDSAATEIHFMYFINKLKPLLGDFTKTALKNFYLASFEATGTVWTPGMSTVFQRMHGYDLAKYLPYLFDKNFFDQKTSAAFKKDYDHTISELMINNHYRKGREIANRYGLKLISESGGPGPPLHNAPVESMKALGALDVPRGEFWINHSRFDGRVDSIDLLMLVKEIASASRIYGRKITELESFTSFQNWQEGPGDMRPIGDRAFCEGMNRVVVHGFTHNPSGIGYPGIVYAAGTHYNDKTTWWPKVRPFNEYLSRISYLLQETEFVADAVYYYGDKVPNFATPKNTRFAAGSGYDYEIINTEILLRDLTVSNGILSLPGGGKFRVLALGKIAPDNKLVWAKIKSLIAGGAVVTLSEEFARDPSGKNILQTHGSGVDEKSNSAGATTGSVKQSANLNANPYTGVGDSSTNASEKLNELLPADFKPVNSFQSIQVRARTSPTASPKTSPTTSIYTLPVARILEELKVVPDFDYADKGSERLDFMEKNSPLLDYIHYKKGDADFYFVRNTSDGWISRNCIFRQSGKSPELWDPVTGKTVAITIYDEAPGGSGTSLPLTFPPYGSFFIVFKNGSESAHITGIRQPGLRSSTKNAMSGRGMTSPGNASSSVPTSSSVNASSTASTSSPGDASHSGNASSSARASLSGSKSSGTKENPIHPPLIAYRDNGFEILTSGRFELMRKGEAKVEIAEASPQSFEITGDWDLSFPPGWGAPATAKFSKLISWTESDDPGIKFFSGTGTYKKQFSYKPAAAIDEDESIYLDLGRASKVVEVWLNGKSLGISWTLPHRFNVSGLLKSGQNELKIEVINTWSNRIIGDINSEKKYTYTNLNVRGSRELLWTETPLTESGLLGPVRIETVKKIQVVR